MVGMGRQYESPLSGFPSGQLGVMTRAWNRSHCSPIHGNLLLFGRRGIGRNKYLGLHFGPFCQLSSTFPSANPKTGCLGSIVIIYRQKTRDNLWTCPKPWLYPIELAFRWGFFYGSRPKPPHPTAGALMACPTLMGRAPDPTNLGRYTPQAKRIVPVSGTIIRTVRQRNDLAKTRVHGIMPQVVHVVIHSAHLENGTDLWQASLEQEDP
jgi:hypothetical protein